MLFTLIFLLSATPLFPYSPVIPGPVVRPVPGAVITGYSAPELNWDSGHRGVDLEARVGESVRAAAAGTVSYVGSVAGVPIVVVNHGTLRTTYEPVAASVVEGQHVTAGASIGVVEPGHPSCPGRTCLHWGAKVGEHYRNPLSLLKPARIRLIPVQARG